MPKLNFTQDELDAYARVEKNILHHYHVKNVEMADRIMVHSDGKFPEKLIKERRPHEPELVFQYREKIFVAKTKPYFSKVFSSLQKIRRSNEWAIQYPNNGNKFSKIAPDESLQQYCEYKYPFFTSVTNWVFDVVLRKQLIDPNGVGFVYPPDFTSTTPENGYVEPICEVFGSDLVIDFFPEDYAVLKNPKGARFFSENGSEIGFSFYVVTVERIRRYDQINLQGDYKLIVDWPHLLGELPVFQLKGIVVEHSANGFQYESRIAAMLPELDEAIREYSDLQAAKVLHIYPERYEYTDTECRVCKGQGHRPNPNWTVDCGCDRTIECQHCGGIGLVSGASPYSKLLLKRTNALEGGTGFLPPPGYVQKDTAIVELQEKGVQAHMYYALAAINYEHLAEVPLAQSGVSKEHDKDEANNWTHSVAEDLVAFMDMVYYFTALYRYLYSYPKEKIIEMLPAINVPERYDLVSASQMQEELKAAKDSKINPILLTAFEEDYAAKRFATNPQIRTQLQLLFKLDPLPNVSEEDKMVMLSNGGISKESYIISSNIGEFIQRAIDEDENFVDWETEQQKEKLKEYAAELMVPPVDVNAIMAEGDQAEEEVEEEIEA